MPHLPSLGSGALPAQLHRIGTELRAEITRHSRELTTGRSADPARRLSGETGLLSAIESRLRRNAAEEAALIGQGQRAAAIQAGLDQVAAVHEGLRSATLAAAFGEPSPAVLNRLGQQARAALGDIGSALARGLAGQAVFAGDRPDRAPLAPPEVLLAAAAAAVAGASSADQVVQRVQDMFGPGGAFDTAIYLGGAPVPLAAGDADFGPAPTAGDPALREILAGAVLAALAGDPTAIPDIGLRRGLVSRAIDQQAAAAERLTNLAAGLGAAEAAIAERRTRLVAEREMLELGRNNRLGVDPYEAATRLEDARQRLEALYVVTARVARLTLTEYLR